MTRRSAQDKEVFVADRPAQWIGYCTPDFGHVACRIPSLLVILSLNLIFGKMLRPYCMFCIMTCKMQINKYVEVIVECDIEG
jgi:hypothetical protein